MLTVSGHGKLGTVKGKGARGWLIQSGIPGLWANLNGQEALIGTTGQHQLIIKYPRKRLAYHVTSMPSGATS